MSIRAKTQIKDRFADKTTPRFVWYPLSPLNLADSQATSPLWEHRIPRATIVKQEAVSYRVKGDYSELPEHPQEGATLELQEMGTDAQIKFLMLFEPKGMTYLESMDGLDDETAIDIDEDIFPMEKRPQSLIDLRTHLQNYINQEHPDQELFAISKPVAEAMLDGVERSIQWVNEHVSMLEREFQEARAGRQGRGELNQMDEYYFNQIKRPMPDQRAGANFGDNLAEVLQKALGRSDNGMEEELLKLRAEVETLREADKVNKQVIKQYEEE